MNNVYLVGLTHETINSAILLASLDYQVVLVSNRDVADAFLAIYHFDKQVKMLWQFYCDDDKISIDDTLMINDTANYSNNHLNNHSNNHLNHNVHQNDNVNDYYRSVTNRVFWLFLDDKTAINWVKTAYFLPSDTVILSGSNDIGFFEMLANQIMSVWVYYLPFIFMKEGANFNSFFHSDLVLVGEKTPNSYHKIAIIEFFIKHTQKYFVGTIKTIEFGRIAIMAMLATRLSFINEMARLADSQNVDIKAIEHLMGQDVRIGDKYLQAGWGFGGKSLPAELSRLMGAFADCQVDTTLLKAVSAINDDQKELIFRKFWQYFDGDIEYKTVMIWGAGYRAKAGLTTNSAIHTLLPLLWSYGIKTRLYTKYSKDDIKKQYQHQLLTITDNPYDLDGIDGLFIINISDTQLIDIERLNKIAMPIFDAKNSLNNAQINEFLGYYVGIGRQKNMGH